MLVTSYNETEFGTLLQLESLTLTPINTTPILTDMLLEGEKAWLNTHHAEVYQQFSPHLSGEENEWLAETTEDI